MNEIHSFYLNLLKANDYRGVTGGMETTPCPVRSKMPGGHLEADNYPDAQPGSYTNIRNDFSPYGREIAHRQNWPPLPKPSTSSRSQEAADDRGQKYEHMKNDDQPVAP
jgi:hypothetical protein